MWSFIIFIIVIRSKSRDPQISLLFALAWKIKPTPVFGFLGCSSVPCQVSCRLFVSAFSTLLDLFDLYCTHAETVAYFISTFSSNTWAVNVFQGRSHPSSCSDIEEENEKVEPLSTPGWSRAWNTEGKWDFELTWGHHVNVIATLTMRSWQAGPRSSC